MAVVSTETGLGRVRKLIEQVEDHQVNGMPAVSWHERFGDELEHSAFVAACLPHYIVSQGTTREEAVAALESAIMLHEKWCGKMEPLPADVMAEINAARGPR